MPGDALALGPGDRIGARYRVERVLGKSEMSIVVAARDEQLEEAVAIKVLLPQSVANSEARARFGREVRAAAKIKGEHMARVTDVGTLDDGSPYMVMEHLEGEDLKTMLGRSGPLPVPEAIAYVQQICDVLGEAHALGVIHRHLQPANLFLATRPGRPPALKVLNFGISKVEQVTSGLPWYAAPEQLKSSASVDARSDIWSLGVILYELVTGKVPFAGETVPAVTAKVLHDSPALRHAPPALEPVIRRCLGKAAASRYATASEVARALTAERGPEARDSSAMIVDPSEAEIVDTSDEGDPLDQNDGDVVDEAELLPPSSRASAASAASAAVAAPVAARPNYLLPVVAAVIFLPLTALLGARLFTPVEPAPPMPEAKQNPPAPLAPLPPPSAAPGSSTASAPENEPAPPSISAALEVVTSDPPPGPARALSTASAAPKEDDDGAVAVQVAMRHHNTVREACWETSDRTSYVVSVSASVDASGAVTASNATSGDPKLAACVAGQVRTWTFPSSPGGRSVQFPVRFRR